MTNQVKAAPSHRESQRKMTMSRRELNVRKVKCECEVTSEEHTIPGVTCHALYSPLLMDSFHHFLNLSPFLFMYLTEIA